MSAHSSVLAWEIPWTEETCGLQSMGKSQSRFSDQTTTNILYNTGNMANIL